MDVLCCFTRFTLAYYAWLTIFKLTRPHLSGERGEILKIFSFALQNYIATKTIFTVLKFVGLAIGY